MKLLITFIFLCHFTWAVTPEEHATLKALPIISSKCIACHGEDPNDIDGELNLLSREGFLKGGEFIKNLLIPGNPGESFLMTVIKWEDPDFEMPPKENDRLTQEQILDIETWIKNGAPWPSRAAQKKILASEKNCVQ